MARTIDKVVLTFFLLASDYDPVHYFWTEKELAALGDCKAVAEVIKKRLEGNGTKVKEMYVIEHKSEKKTDSKSRKFHGVIDETKPHYHILVRFEPSHGATLKEIAEYIGVPFPLVIKPDRGRFSYSNCLAYLIHIKEDIDKIHYSPKEIVTLAGSDYTDYFNENRERWERAREIKAKKGGKPLDRRFREAIKKLHDGEIVYAELRGINEYRELLKNPTYARELLKKARCMANLAEQDYFALLDKIQKKELTSLDEITTNKDWELAYKYYKDKIDFDLRMYARK